MTLKSGFKYCLYKLHLAKWADRFFFYYSGWKHKNKNLTFCREYPERIIPPNRWLHETFRLDYRKFFEQGELAATEMIQWAGKYLKTDTPVILDWGCGIARITQYLPAACPGAVIYGCDINEAMIEWNKTRYPGITFMQLLPFLPFPFADDFFDLLIGFSVLTHIDATEQENRLKEICRILKPGGVAILTTHGDKYFNQLTNKEKTIVLRKGVYTRTYHKPGHRMMTTYHEPGAFKKMIGAHFSIREYHPGKSDLSKTGGQDLWILQK